ncbi:MAG TPA: hypothetical protein VIY48_00940 [Candidatus Paceibacterota bacterium]
MIYRKEPKPEQLMALDLGAKYQQLQAPLTADVRKMIQSVENKVFAAIQQKEFTPDMAYQAWHEVHAYHRLLQKFNQRIKIGVSEGEELAPTLNGEDNG